MKSINEYKRRFNMLLESKMGDVKPLISEAPQFEEFVVPTLDMLKDAIVRTVKDGKITGDLISYDDNFKKTFTGNEYKITLPEGMYEAGEEISVDFYMDPIFIIQNVISYKSANVVTDYQNNTAYVAKAWNLDNFISFQFKIPNTQKELEENSPFITYVDFRCKNVRGGKLRFSVEVPSGSEIYETEKPVPTPTPTPNENYKPVPTPTYNPNY